VLPFKAENWLMIDTSSLVWDFDSLMGTGSATDFSCDKIMTMRMTGNSTFAATSYRCMGKVIDSYGGLEEARIIIKNFRTSELSALSAGTLTIRMK